MTKIGLLSDTHSHLDPRIFEHFKDCHQIWHAGDIGDHSVADQLQAFRPFYAVYGNIDDSAMRHRFPLNLDIHTEGLHTFMTHIGGYPGRLNQRVKELLDQKKPNLYISGHSHILKIMPDNNRNLLHINPGAVGKHGFHKIQTIVRFAIHKAKIHELEVIELGLRAKIS